MTVEKLVLWTRGRQVIDDLISKNESALANASRFEADSPHVSPTWRFRMSERRHVPCAYAAEQSLFHTVSYRRNHA